MKISKIAISMLLFLNISSTNAFAQSYLYEVPPVDEVTYMKEMSILKENTEYIKKSTEDIKNSTEIINNTLKEIEVAKEELENARAEIEKDIQNSLECTSNYEISEELLELYQADEDVSKLLEEIKRLEEINALTDYENLEESPNNNLILESEELSKDNEILEDSEINQDLDNDNEFEENKDSYALTPNGNFTLVDDYKIEDVANSEDEIPNSKEFLTIATKGGNYLYLVIDKNGDKENVYFLNMVDEADIIALINEEPVPIEVKPVPTAPPVAPPIAEEIVVEEVAKPTSTNSNTSSLILVMFLAIGTVIAIKYKTIKSKIGFLNKGKTDNPAIRRNAKQEYDVSNTSENNISDNDLNVINKFAEMTEQEEAEQELAKNESKQQAESESKNQNSENDNIDKELDKLKGQNIND